MRWRLVTTEFPPRLNGISTWSAGVARALHEAGEEVIVHARAPDRSQPYRVIAMPGRSWRRWSGWWSAVSVRPRRREGDVVLCATWPLAVHLPGPVLVAWHGSELTRPAALAGRSDVAARAVNLPVSRYLGSLLHAPHTVLPAPVSPTPPARRGDAILAIARLVPSKGVDRAIHLARRLSRPLVVVGDGPERPALERLAADLGVLAHFRGETAEVPWDGTWALALLSRCEADGSGAEGLGLVLLEAAARGIPSIGTRVGGIPEAASVVIDDPERDDIPPLPPAEEVRARLAAEHGPERVVEALRKAAGAV